MTRRYFVGLNAGSSLFGVDAALVRTEGTGLAMSACQEAFLHLPYSAELRQLLMRVCTSATIEARHLGMVHRVLSEHCALAVRQLLEQNRTLAREVLALGFPGLTLWHDAEGRFPSTVSLGMPAIIAERTGLTVASDLASRDLAAGGQGTPLSALIDAQLFHDPREERVLLHLGSVASIVVLPRQTDFERRQVVGFQAAPCTMLLDGLMSLLTNGRETFDSSGKHAVQGRCLEPILARWIQNHFFQKRPPKCVPRWEFGPDFLSRGIEQAKHIDGTLHDILCTMTHFIAHAIVHAVQTYLPATPTRILVSGRGARNGFLWRLLEQMLTPIPMEKTEAHGVSSEARQAVAHAVLAALTLDGVPANLPSVTGAAGSRVLGALTPGDARNWNRCMVYLAHQASPINFAAA